MVSLGAGPYIAYIDCFLPEYHSPELRHLHNGLSKVLGLLSCNGGPYRRIRAVAAVGKI